MDKASIAESILTRVSTRQHASEIVGDLLEQSPSWAAFVWTIFRIAIVMSWVRALGLLAAMSSLVWVLLGFKEVAGPHFMTIFEAYARSHTATDQNIFIRAQDAGFTPWDLTAKVCLAVSICTWASAVLISTWFPEGRRKSVPGYITAVLLTLISWSSAVPWLEGTLLFALGAAIAFFMAQRSWRGSFSLAAYGAVLTALPTALTAITLSLAQKQINAAVGQSAGNDVLGATTFCTLLAAPLAALVGLRHLERSHHISPAETNY